MKTSVGMWLWTAISAMAIYSALGQIDPTDFRGCEVAIAIDTSGSMTGVQFGDIQAFVSNLIDGLPNYGFEEGVRVGLVQFSDTSTIISRLSDQPNKDDKRMTVLDMLHFGGLTMTHLAIRDMVTILNEGNPRNKKAGLIITDGNSDEPLLTLTEAINFRRTRVLIVMGIGSNIDDARMVELTGDPTLYFAVSFANLNTVQQTILNMICIPPCTRPNFIDTCQTCEYESGVYVFEDCNECSIYRQCIQGSTDFPEPRHCPFGEFFDFKKSSCNFAGRVDCSVDKCRNGTVLRYEDKYNCRSYWECQLDRTVGQNCCPPGEEFAIATLSCVADADGSCTDSCPPVHPVLDRCTRTAVNGVPSKYQDETQPGVFVLKDCAYGSNFDPTTCECSILLRETSSAIPCDPMLYLPFAKNVQPSPRKGIHVANPKWNRVRVTAADGAYFNGRSRLHIPHFSEYSFGHVVRVRTQFREDRTVTRNRIETLFGNGACAEDQTISCKYNRQTDTVEAKIITVMGGKEVTFTTSVANIARDPTVKNVVMRYNGMLLTLEVNGNTNSVEAYGEIAMRRGPLMIGGGCGNSDLFAGWQDEFFIDNCAD